MGDTEPDVSEVPDGWAVVDGKLHRDLTFDDFAAAFAFMTRVAAEAERADHHPDWSNSSHAVSIDLFSHDVGRITARDLGLAEAIDAVLGDRPSSGT